MLNFFFFRPDLVIFTFTEILFHAFGVVENTVLPLLSLLPFL